MHTHLHIGYGIVGYGPENDDGTPTLDTWEDVADYLHSELSTVVDMIGEDADAHADTGEYETAWHTLKRSDDVDILRRNLDPRRRFAPLYANDPAAWNDTIQRTIADNFPLDVTGATRLYVWECAETECADDDN